MAPRPARIRKLHAEGLSVPEICARLLCDRKAVLKVVEAEEAADETADVIGSIAHILRDIADGIARPAKDDRCLWPDGCDSERDPEVRWPYCRAHYDRARRTRLYREER